MARSRSAARAAALRSDQGYNPSTGKMEKISQYGVTVGGAQHRGAMTGGVRAGYSNYTPEQKRKLGICSSEGCMKIHGHSGEHS